jgi:hypothetical protein
MTPLLLRAVAVLAGLVAVGVFAGCLDLRATLAQSELFAEYREELIDECCTCLAEESSFHESATCQETGGPPIPDEDHTAGIPCLCGGTLETCQAALRSGNAITVSGACITESEFGPPCGQACANVLSFESVDTGG